MFTKMTWRVLAGFATVAALAAAPQGASQGSVTINLSPKYIGTGDTRVIEVFDVHCNTSKGQHRITGGGSSVAITLCTSSAGYGKLRHRNVTNNGGWVESSLLSSGENVYP